ncbi:MAG: PilW family protein [Vicinamibacterales bacterium]
MSVRDRHGLQRGLTLVELLVALAIGAFLIFGATQVYVDSRNTYGSNEALARLQETARFAMAIIEPDVRMAGYLGLTKGSENIVNESTYNGSLGAPAKLCGDNFVGDFENAVQGSTNEYSLGYDNTTKKAGCDTLINTTTSSAWTTAAVNSADTLIVRRVSVSPISTIPSCNSTATGGLPYCNTIQVCATRTRAYLFDNGAVPSGCTAPSFPTGFPEQSDSFIYNVVVDAYYIDKNSLQGTALPSLRRKFLTNSGTGGNPVFRDMEVVDGVEDLQIEYGVETAVSAATGDLHWRRQSLCGRQDPRRRSSRRVDRSSPCACG